MAYLDVPVVHIIFNNLENFLPPGLFGTDKIPDGASAIYSTQVGDPITSQEQSQVLADDPLVMKFSFDEVKLTHMWPA